MIIDFHAHIYPAKIATKATQSIGNFYDKEMQCTGLVQELLKSGAAIGVSKYLVHSASTTSTQVESINNFIIDEIQKEEKFEGFGTMHPDYVEFEKELKRIKEKNLKGIKLHPDFQKFRADIDIMDPIYETLAELKMPVLFHAGDSRFNYSNPRFIKNVLQKHPNLIVIAAHFGGYKEWNESEMFLVGKNVYFDTSSSLWALPYPDAEKMIQKHGVEKFLFGSDFPMWSHHEEFLRFEKLNLSSSDKDLILYKNAQKLLNI